jgi:hypothetical protein
VATGAQAVEVVAKATNIPLATVDRAARTLMEADPNLWPKGKKGGGKGAAHVRPTHLVNLLLAVMAANPITAAPAVVRRLRQLEVDGVSEYKTIEANLSRTTVQTWRSLRGLPGLQVRMGDAGIAKPIVPGDNLGEALETMVGIAKSVESRDYFCKIFDGLTVWRSGDLASIGIRAEDGQSASSVLYTEPKPQATEPKPVAPITAPISIPARIFEILAALALDTERVLGPELAHQGEGSPPTVPTVENESGPPVDADEPLPSDAPRAGKPETTGSHLKARRERDKSQVGFESYGDASDGSSLSNRGSTDEARPKRYG